MSPRKRQVPEAAEKQGEGIQISQEEYAAFVQQIDLESLWLASADIENRQGPTPPSDLHVDIQTNSRYENRDSAFDAFTSYHLAFGRAEAAEAAGHIKVTFGLRFSSQQPMTDPLFDIFSDVNLPVNTWPFLREFVQTTVVRMNWPALTLPTFKVGTDRRRVGRARRSQMKPPPDAEG